MAELHDTVALVWVKGAIGDCLAQARLALEQFSAEAGDADALAGFIDNLHQVRGCLVMLELSGAALLAEELEHLGRALQDKHVSQRGEALGALFRGLEQLPLYLDRLRSARRDLPLVVLPVLNQLRAERGVEPLGQGSLLSTAPAPAEELANLDSSLSALRERLHAGSDRDALRSVVAALCEDLMRVKERLDLFVRSDRQRLDDLQPLLSPLRQIADTLAVLGFGQPRRVIIDQVLALQSLAQGQRAPDDAVLMDVAGALLYVEATLAGMVGPLEHHPSQSSLPGTDLAEIRQLVLEEANAVLQQVKDQIGDSLEAGWQPHRMPPLPGLLQQVRGALAMLMLPRPAALIGRCGDYAQANLLGATPPDATALAHLADALSACECYLQWLIADPQANPWNFLEAAQASLAALGYAPEPVPAVEVYVPDVEEPVVDDELREVFLEEAAELLPQLNVQWARWQANPTDRDALVELRRGLHTLKGSGRMVRAQGLAELAWAAEHFLNRVLEGRVEIGAAPLAGLQQALDLIPGLMAAFANGQSQAGKDIEQLALRLHALAMNDAPPQADTDESIDPQLLEIFRNEAEGHLASLDSFLERAEQQLPQPVSDALQRALHTLKGSAAMAGVAPIAELAGALDLLAREFKAHQLAFDLEEIYLLESAEPLLRRGLEQLNRAPLAPIAGASTLIEEIHQVVEARLQALLQAPSHSVRIKRDPQLIASFLAQGMDILLDAESLLLRWQEHPGERQELTALLEELTTLGQSAHLADLWPVDDLCEALLDLYGAVEESSLVVSERFFEEAQHAHEALIDMLDQIAAGQEVDPRPERLKALRELLDDALAPDATGLISTRNGQAQIAELGAATAALDAEPAMVELFLEEACDVLESADQALARGLAEPDHASALSTLQRDLQTLKVGAQMAAIGSVEVLARELELLYEGLVDRRFSLTPELGDLLKRSHAQLAQVLASLQQGQAPASAVELLAALREFRHEAPPAVIADKPADPAQEAGDKELLEIFLEESFDIVESSGAALLRWQAEPRNGVEVENLLRDLHTLKGGARMVEIAPIGDLAHELEFLYELLAAGQLQPSAALFSLLQNCHDRLAHMLDAVRLHQPLHAATALIDYIRNFSSAALADTAAQHSNPDAAPAELPVAAPERGPVDMVKVASELLDDLGNLAGEHSIIRGRIEQQVNDAQVALSEMETTLERMRDQLRRLDTETQGRILSRQQADGDSHAYDDFDPLEMDRHSQLQQLSRALFESASDLLDLKETLSIRAQDAHSLLQQQARVNSELQEGLMRTRMVPFERLVPRLQRVVRQVASELGKQVELVVGNAEGEMDRSVLERMVAPLEHMLRNAVDHGLEARDVRLAAGKPEQGLISLNLLHEGADIVIEMTDDGAGVPLDAVRRKAIKRGLLDPDAVLSDHEIMQFILQPGFSTAEKITQISGRGLGMDVVHEEVKQLGGSMVIESNPGKGARFLIRLPFTVSVNRALMVQFGDEQYAVPLNTIEGIVRVPPAELETCYRLESPHYEYAGHRYALHYLGELLQGAGQPRLLGQSLPLPVLLVHSHDQQFAIQVDSLAASREIVVKSLGRQFAGVQGLSGATLLGDGRVVLILDLLGQLRGLQLRQAQTAGSNASLRRQQIERAPKRPLLVMVVDDSVTVRKVTGRLLERHGMNVLTAKDGVDAMALLQEHRPDILLLDIEMPRMDGFEVATQIRHDPELKDLPIIMITSRTGQKHRDRAMSIGVNDYLGKPYQESVLLQSIALWSRRHA
ncbi:Hpt domain-containing protein [Pseudomonas sp. GD03860]|uniref:Hpt domain-containing protein n=1 Tax=Pseudomonas TaxID=286 RepID=UPI002363201A|nr:MULTISPECIES: Hpt domain-containing protein [Pseudomonas]MDD2060031.1 Hpt domain-containing protein [Pseudomonas putida]MDH0636549.1 Hpt domain-containing protein [Pseudomonas sp. GD03860]